MRVLTGSWAGWDARPLPTVVTIGVFDGVHIGHRLLLKRLGGQGLVPTVVTFDPHPAAVLAPGAEPPLITTIDERLRLLESLGIELVAVVDLAEIREFSPDRFLSDVLKSKLNMARLVAGADFQFGKNRAGDIAYLSRAREEFRFDLEVVDLVVEDGMISSTRIRRLIEEGEVSRASALLGSRYRLTNVVIHGDRRGQEMGFPTANLRPPPRKVIPGRGVYAAYAHLDESIHPAAVSVGVRPTFGGGELLIEAMLLDFSGDLYDRPLTLEFVERLRPELEFGSVEELMAAMAEDVARTRRILAATTPVVG